MFSKLYNKIKSFLQRTVEMGSKLQLGKGLKIETQEQKNVMTPCSLPFWFLTPMVLVAIFCNQCVYPVLGLFALYLLFFVALYIYHAIRNPKMLQSEKYQIEYHKIMLMQESKNPIHVEAHSLVESTPNENPPALLETDDKGDKV
ncbi:hypothetical protein [Candidatus Avelusimicrobium fimicolum]|uniref:hypothetical protein n=1 Tax=Candidatus Avelusimicrobium fimicolum TaxID=3416216 RepID=UPI003D1014C1